MNFLIQRLLSDIASEKLLWAKFVLFLFLGCLCLGFLVYQLGFPNSFLVLFAIWAFCRSYYFVFYVIEKYVDPSYKFDGIIDFMKYAIKRSRDRIRNS